MRKLIVAFATSIAVMLCLSGCACEHEWGGATCTEPKTCIKCGETEGEPLGHEWKEATCTEPQKCARCSATEGEPIPHKLGEYTVQKEATYAEEGEEVAVCEVCGATATKKLPKVKSFSTQTSDGDYPFAVDESKIKYSRILNATVKRTSDYPYQVVFHDGDNLDEPTELTFNIKNDKKCAYAVSISQVETTCIDINLSDGQTVKAFVNTELSLRNAPSNWGQDNSLYQLGESGSCYMFDSEVGTILAIKDIVSGSGYLAYVFW